MGDYNAIQKFFTEKNLHFFTFYTKPDKPVKDIIKYVLGNTSGEDIAVALQEIDYDVISVKQMTAKCPTPEGGVTYSSLPLFLVTLAKNQKAREIFKLTTLYNIIKKVEACKSQNGLTQCYSCQRFNHIRVHSKQPHFLWCGDGHHYCECSEKQNSESAPICYSYNLQDGESPQQASYRSCSHFQELQCRKNMQATARVSREDVLLEMHNT
jgi:hypothetical protein